MALVALLLAAIAAPAPAAGPQPPGHGDGEFSCRASALRVSLLGNVLLEPIVANEQNVPCQDEDNRVLGPGSVGPITIQPGGVVYATTDALSDGAHAESGVLKVAVGAAVPGVPSINAEVLTSSADVRCKVGENEPQFSSAGEVVNLRIGGTPIQIPASGASQTINLGLLTIHLNEEVRTGDSITRRALRVSVPRLAEVVIAESIADVKGNPCEEKPPPKPPQCSDGDDNDNDGKIDKWDKGCRDKHGNYDPKDDDESK